MAIQLLTELIDKQDNFEVVGLKIAEILKLETVNQVALATAASKPNPEDWNLQIFTERSNPYEKYLNQKEIKIPIVNIWYDNSSFPKNKGDVVKRQTSETVYNIDIYGFGVATDIPAGGHTPGDLNAALTLHRAIRLVRNILMAAINTKLQLDETEVGVGIRWPQSITEFQPRIDKGAIQQVIGARIALEVHFNEFSPQVIPEILELVSIDVKRTEDGEIVLETDYDFTV